MSPSAVARRLALAVALVIATGVPRATAIGADPPAPGERGELLTALDGTTVESVPVRYVGVLSGAIGPGIDLHLIEIEGPVGERIGVASGMSGSPVRFGGRTFGALSYRMGALPRRAIAGVTRIEDMERAARSTSAPADAAGFVPIAAPVHFGGLAPAVRAWLAPRLAEFGLSGALGGDRSDDEGGPGTGLRPGSPVGVELVRGAVRIAATGTVTAVDGDRVLAFGHPFLGTGRVEAPMVEAEIVHTLEDAAGSVKLANVGREIGAIVDDRLTAVVGRVGAHADMLPVTVTTAVGDDPPREDAYEVVRDSPLTGLLVGTAVASGMLGSVEAENQATVLADGVIRLEGLPDVAVDLAFSSSAGPDPVFRVAAELQRTLDGLVRSPLGRATPVEIRVHVRVDPRPRSYVLKTLLYDRTAPRPGGSLAVTAVLASYRGPEIRRTLDVRIPEGIAPGTRLALAVGSPQDLDTVSGRPWAARLGSANDLHAYVDALSELRGAHRLCAQLFRSDAGVVTDGERYSELPPSARGLVVSGSARRDWTPLAYAPIARTEIVLDGPVSGGLAAAIVVGARDRPEGSAP